MVDHLLHPPLPEREQLRDDPEVLLRSVDRHPLHGFVRLAVDRSDHDLRLADGELEPLAPHHLHQDRQLEFAPTLHLPHLGSLGVQHPDRDVADHLLIQARLQQPGRHLGAVLPGQRRRVDRDRDAERGLVDPRDREGMGIVEVGEGLANRDLGDPRHRADLAGTGEVGLDPVQRLGHVELGDLGPLDGAVGPAPRHRVAPAELAVADAAEGQPPDVRRRIEVGHEGLERRALVVPGGGHVLQQRLEQRGERRLERVGRPPALPRPSVREQDREADLVLVRVQIQEELLDLVDDLGRPRVAAVHLVHDQDHRQSRFERLPEHEARLGQWALRGIHQ